MTYPQRVADNILPLSIIKSLPDALREWSFTGDVQDHDEAEETCQLCDQEQLRYHFLIRNALNRNTLWIGSHCILKFGISVFEAGRKLTPEEAKKKLNRMIDMMRLDSCIKALRRLASEEQNEILTNALAYYENNGVLTPKFAFVVLWRLGQHKIDHSPSFFKVCLRRDKHKRDLEDMPTDRVWTLWPALSSSQRALAQKLGHISPPPSK